MTAVAGTAPFKPVQEVATETVYYLGYEIEVCNRDLLIFAPNRDIACFLSMAEARRWIRQHRKEVNTGAEAPKV